MFDEWAYASLYDSEDIFEDSFSNTRGEAEPKSLVGLTELTVTNLWGFLHFKNISPRRAKLMHESPRATITEYTSPANLLTAGYELTNSVGPDWELGAAALVNVAFCRTMTGNCEVTVDSEVLVNGHLAVLNHDKLTRDVAGLLDVDVPLLIDTTLAVNGNVNYFHRFEVFEGVTHFGLRRFVSADNYQIFNALTGGSFKLPHVTVMVDDDSATFDILKLCTEIEGVRRELSNNHPATFTDLMLAKKNFIYADDDVAMDDDGVHYVMNGFPVPVRLKNIELILNTSEVEQARGMTEQFVTFYNELRDIVQKRRELVDQLSN